MKNLILLYIFLSFVYCINGQVVTADPAMPTDNQGVTITFHADQGNKGLMNYSGDDVYAHTGVITDKSASASDWKYIKATWATNTAACKLTRLSANEYQIAISPNIREFYGVPSGEKILKMAFVFRNANGSKTGRDAGGGDIFLPVYEQGLNVSFVQPAERFAFAIENDAVSIEISATEADSLFLYLDANLIKKIPGTAFDTSVVAKGSSLHRLVAAAKKGVEIACDTAWFLVPGITPEATLPAAIEDGITYPANDSAIFVVYAPNKEYIYLVGDFNDWLPDSVYQFKKDGDRFWISLGGLIPGTEYAFQYLINGDIRVTDPYAEKVLDPDNDKYIPETVYPNLLSYPTKTQGIAGVIQPGKENYTWIEDGFVPPATQELVIYELLIRDFVSTHAIKDVADKLDYLQTLGVNAIELMPFSEFVGNSSWGYNPSFYFAPDKYYGRDTDIKDFIQECHNRGIAVIMDMVLNHAERQNPMVSMYFNTATGKPSADNPWFNVNSPNSSYSWGYDFNHQSAATQYFVDRVVEYWLTEYKIDGFRFDFTKGFTNTTGNGSAYDAPRITILERIYDKLKSVNTDAYMICEHFADNSEEKVLSDYGMLLWGNSNYNFNEATMGYLDNSDFSWSSYKAREWSDPHLVSYMESHDEERLMFKNITYGNSTVGYNIKDPATALHRMQLAGAFYFAIPGPKMIWQFGELGYDVSIDFNDRVGEKPVKWEYWDNADRQCLYLTWAKILEVRKKYPVFQTDDFTLNVGNNLAFKKIVLRHADMDAIVVGNFGITDATAQPGFTKTGWWHELFTGDSVNITNVATTVTLNAGEYRLYTSGKMESVINGVDETGKEQLHIYPNPVSDCLYIYNDRGIEKYGVYDMSGNKVMDGAPAKNNGMLNVSGLQSGFYVLRIQTWDGVSIGRFVKK